MSHSPEVACLCRVIAAALDRRYDEPSAASEDSGGGDSLMAKFLAARAKMDKPHWKRGQQGASKSDRKPLRIFDPTDRAASVGSAHADLLLCSLPTNSPGARAKLTCALQSAGPMSCHIVLANHREVKADPALCALLLPTAGAIFVVPVQGDHASEFICCGGNAMTAGAARGDGGCTPPLPTQLSQQ